MDWSGTSNVAAALPDVVFGTFYPSISAEKFKSLYRIPAELPGAVVTEQLRLAGLAVIRELRNWRETRSEETLAAIEQETADGVGELVLAFERAVYCEAKAELLRETVTVDRRSQAENAAKSGEETENKYREFAADAIAAIIGARRVAVELI